MGSYRLLNLTLRYATTPSLARVIYVLSLVSRRFESIPDSNMSPTLLSYYNGKTLDLKLL